MAYDGDNLSLISSAPLTGAGQTWRYTEDTAAANIDAAGYFADGGDRGMRVGDMLYHYDTSSADAVIVTGHVVNSVSSTAPGAANVSIGVVVGTGGTSGD